METIVVSSLVGSTINSIYNLLTDIINYNLDEINNSLDNIDIHNTVQIVENLLNEIDGTHAYPKTVSIVIENIHETIKKINDQLSNLNTLIINHQQKYFYRWRFLNYLFHLEKIQQYNNILSSRVSTLLNLLN